MTNNVQNTFLSQLQILSNKISLYFLQCSLVSCSDKESESHGTKLPIVPACPHQLAPIIRFLCEILLSEQGVAWARSVTMSHAPDSAHVP